MNVLVFDTSSFAVVSYFEAQNVFVLKRYQVHAHSVKTQKLLVVEKIAKFKIVLN